MYEVYINTNGYFSSDGSIYPNAQNFHYNASMGVRDFTLRLLNSQCYITVIGLTSGQMSIVALASKTRRTMALPWPGNEGVLTAEPLDDFMLSLHLMSSSLVDAEYKVYFTLAELEGKEAVCDPRNMVPGCRVMHTVCGMRLNGDSASGRPWITGWEPEQDVTSEVHVQNNRTYFFNVVVRPASGDSQEATGLELAYQGVRASNTVVRVKENKQCTPHI
eukprot:PLAT198.1.p2 GENE.PLAT198.1~~PLAT198.1.p2  ORF type:complete len:219 (+),score=79.86 PLAT198.1:299-955(+)